MDPSQALSSFLCAVARASAGYNHSTPIHPFSPTVKAKRSPCPQKCLPRPEGNSQAGSPSSPWKRGLFHLAFHTVLLLSRALYPGERVQTRPVWINSTPGPAAGFLAKYPDPQIVGETSLRTSPLTGLGKHRMRLPPRALPEEREAGDPLP